MQPTILTILHMIYIPNSASAYHTYCKILFMNDGMSIFIQKLETIQHHSHQQKTSEHLHHGSISQTRQTVYFHLVLTVYFYLVLTAEGWHSHRSLC